MPASPARETKVTALRKRGALHPTPDRVQDELFLAHDFFDARDLVQVKYEMIRRVQKDDWPINKAASAFGLSRPAYYAAQAAFEREGLAGLLPKKRGRRTSHKLTPEVMEFVTQARIDDPRLTTVELVARINERFGVTVHRRSLERAGQKQGKSSR